MGEAPSSDEMPDGQFESAALSPDQASLWFLGQAGLVIRSCGCTVCIDPYLSDSVAKVAPGFRRRYPPPVRPEDLRADVLIITHDHLDHLDPETLRPYRHKQSTLFVAPRLAARKLREFEVPPGNIVRLDSAEKHDIAGAVSITGTYAVPTSADVIDTTGYLVEFPNGRSLYNPGDTAFSGLLLESAPSAEVLVVPINGKWLNLNVHEAVKLACAVRPRYVVPSHYDLMELNAENPRTFEHFMGQADASIEVRILDVMKPFVW